MSILTLSCKSGVELCAFAIDILESAFKMITRIGKQGEREDAITHQETPLQLVHQYLQLHL